MHLVNAQLKLHQIQLEKGVFYFQWVHQEQELTRDPIKPIDKLLYLVYCKDLVVRDRFKSLIDLPKRDVQYRRDVLSQHFYELILEHAKLKLKEPDHNSVCSCQIQLDLQPKVKPRILKIYHQLSTSHMGENIQNDEEPTILGCLNVLLNIHDALKQLKAQKKQEQEDFEYAKELRQKEMFLDPESPTCPLCGISYDMTIDDREYYLPLRYLIYMP